MLMNVIFGLSFCLFEKFNHIWAISMDATYSFPTIILYLIAFHDIKFKPNPIPNNLKGVFFFFPTYLILN